METYAEFSDRINSFQFKELKLGDGDFTVNPSVLKKVDNSNKFNNFYGDTVVFDLDKNTKDIISNIVDELYKNTEECFCERLIPSTFHMTLHDLNNSSNLDEISADMIKTEAVIKDKLHYKPIQKHTITMQTGYIFNMVNTSIVLGLFPFNETEYNKLMKLYNYVDDIKALPYPLTPHITLAYYNRNGFSKENCKKLEKIVNKLNKSSFEIILSTDKLTYQNFTTMNNYKNIFCFT